MRFPLPLPAFWRDHGKREGEVARMDTLEAMPFSDEAAARRFAADHGGRLVRLADTPRSYILDGDAS
jgi:nitrous oxide reductase accessory protein NosL